MTLADRHSPPEVEQWINGALFDQVPLGIAILDRDLKVVLANSTFSAVFGEPRGRPCFAVYKRRAAPCERCAAAKTFRDGRFRVNEEHGLDCLGLPADYAVYHAPVRDSTGVVSHVINLSADVTERSRLVREYDQLFEQVPCCLAVIDRELRVVRVNARFRATFGETRGSRCFELYKRRTAPCDDCPAVASFADGSLHSSRQQCLTARGETAQFVVSTAPFVRDGNGSGPIVNMAVDVTEVQELSGRLLEQRLENERLAVTSQTAAHVAHAIKNVLAGLQGGVYEIRTGLRTGVPVRTSRGLEVFDRNFSRISRLVRSFLSFSREHLPRRVPVDPGQLAREVVELYQPVAEQRGVALELVCAAPELSAKLDPEDIHTCLANLITNAVEACQAGGIAAAPRVTVEVGASCGSVSFTVSDNGCGMSQEICDRVLRGGVSTKGGGGTGLGLLVTGKLARDHGGTIACESTPGEGTVFRLTLPVESAIIGSDEHKES